MFVRFSGAALLLITTGLEVGHIKDSTAGLVQQEDVRHKRSFGQITVGWELLQWLQPYVQYEFSKFVTRRMNELDGSDTGTLNPYYDQDYSEIVTSQHLGFGVEGYFALNVNVDKRIRYQIGYDIPQDVGVVNDISYGDIDWSKTTTGQHSSGYTIHARVQLDMPLGLLDRHGAYWTVGATILKRYWGGDGDQVKPVGKWPVNFMVEAGGFVGVGMFF